MGIFDTLIVQPIFNLLLVLYGLIGDFGVAIILFTIIAKFALWPLTRKQLHQTKLMRKLQPELAKIKKNAAGNRQLESLQMMELYKKHNVKPFGSMLVLIIQLPIFISLYRVVLMTMQGEGAVGRYAYGFVTYLHRVADLINTPGEFHPTLFGFIDLSQRATASPVTLSSALVFIMVLGAVLIQYFMAKQQQPKTGKKRKLSEIMKASADGKEVDQSEINSAVSGGMTKFLPIMMFFFFINIFGAAVLYLLTTNLVSLIQQRIIFQNDVEEMEDIAADKVIKDLTKIKEGKVVRSREVPAAKPEKQKYNITRISAGAGKKGGKPNKRRKS